MPRFAYRAKDSTLKVVEGTVEADSEASAISRLGSQGVFPISIVETGTPTSSPLGLVAARVSQRALAYTTRQLADLLGGGLPLLNALTLLAKQIEQPALRRVIEAVAASVRDGRALSDALADHPSIFPPLYRSMVRAGETGGGLEQSLVRLAELGESEAELRSRIYSAAAYPTVVLIVAAGGAMFLMGYVIPSISSVFIETGQALPLPTQILLSISRVVARWWWVLIAGGAALIWALRRWYAGPVGRAVVDRMVLNIPWVGGLVRKLDSGRFARTLGVMMSQGVPVLQAIDVVAQSVSNAVLRPAIAQVEEAVREGSSIAAALNASGQFPAFVSNMVAVGEESGTVDAALLKVATTYEREVDRVIRTLTTVIEPVLLVVVGGVVMFIVLAMLLPVFQIGLVVQ